MTKEQAVARYGAIENGSWANEAMWCTRLAVPAALARHMINTATGLPTEYIYVNKDMAQALLQVFIQILAAGLESELKSFDGCFHVRDVRGMPGELSAHAYALAIDLNAKENALGAIPMICPGIVKIFQSNGFSWGGRFRRRDGMHFSRCWESEIPAS
jgi:hypothetical protein